MEKHARVMLGVLLLLLVVPGLSGLAVAQVQKLTAADGAGNDGFGTSVSISGDLAVIGAPRDDDRGDSSGSAYVFRRIGGLWIDEEKLLAPDGEPGDLFGISVSISGDRAIVGAPGDDDGGDGSGAAYIFRRDAGIWIREQKLVSSEGEPLDFFGYSVSISGDLAVIGENCSNGSRCYAHVYRWDTQLWTEEAKLAASGREAEDWYAYSVAISGELVIVGTPGDDGRGDYTGSAYVYQRNGGAWTEEAKLTASDGVAHDWFGWSVSISGDRAIAGALLYSAGQSGAAYVFRRSAEGWAEEQKLAASDRAQRDQFGYAVSISGDVAIIGAPFNQTIGSAYVFRSAGGAWVEEQNLRASDGAWQDRFGTCVSISGNLAIVGVRDGDDAYVYSLSSGTTTEPARGEIPRQYLLHQNYPNPFNPRTTISFSLPSSGHVTIEMHDVFGKRVGSLLSRALPSGMHEVELDAHDLPPGVYYYTLTAGSFRETRSMTLLK